MMKKITAFLSKPIVIGLLFVMAVGLLLGTGVSGTRAALTYYSPTYQSRLQLSRIGVSLLENGEVVSYRDYDANGKWDQTNNNDQNDGKLLESLLEENETFVIGKRYPEVLTVRNSGDINEFVRVVVTRYWMDENGKKITTVSPALIDLRIINEDVWLHDTEASSAEREVYYYRDLLRTDANNRDTKPLTDSFKVDAKLQAHKSVKEEVVDGKKKTTITYTYDKLRFCIEANVDAVQEHNAQDAIHSSWGKRVQVQGDQLSLGA
ncbi:hypothetical protein [Dubosiella muris]|uniref:Uncharacterized protein n=1 Tax=Dubosiella muris TaxID=3038133 RepID=A0AC61RBY3_9FIRM|nr:hypothetical protein [Dubosiella muris]TGY67318.1 hypothetical protein E5336_00650 [Dubosiella muris]